MDFNCFISVVSTWTELQKSGALREDQREDKHTVNSSRNSATHVIMHTFTFYRILFFILNFDDDVFDF